MTAPTELGGGAGERLNPTPEDLAIMDRNLKRMNRWQKEAGGFNLDAVRRMVHDYLHFSPRGSR